MRAVPRQRPFSAIFCRSDPTSLNGRFVSTLPLVMFAGYDATWLRLAHGPPKPANQAATVFSMLAV
jgi:hypothetical protein